VDWNYDYDYWYFFFFYRVHQGAWIFSLTCFVFSNQLGALSLNSHEFMQNTLVSTLDLYRSYCTFIIFLNHDECDLSIFCAKNTYSCIDGSLLTVDFIVISRYAECLYAEDSKIVILLVRCYFYTLIKSRVWWRVGWNNLYA
jgi:hypothetical protein